MPKKPHKPQEIVLQRLPSLVNHQELCAIGMERREIPDECITASSSSPHSAPIYARLNCNEGAWSASSDSKDHFLQIDLGAVYDVTSVATQGDGDRGDYVTAYKLKYSLDGVSWEYCLEMGKKDSQVFEGNKDCTSVVRRDLSPRVQAKFVRFCPVKWIQSPTMRVEVYGVPSRNVTYDTTLKITDIHGMGIQGCPTLQFKIQLFGEKGFTRRIPLEISATVEDRDTAEDMTYKRKLIAADVGWVKHIKMTYENGNDVSTDDRPSLIQRIRRLSSSGDSSSLIQQESGFFVDQLDVDIGESGQHFTFPCKQWLVQRNTAFDATHRHKSRIASATSNIAIDDEDFEHLLHQEREDTSAEEWKSIKASQGIRTWRRDPKKMETTPLTKTTFDLEGIPFDDAIQLISNLELRKKWDMTFQKVIILEDEGDAHILYCCLRMPRLFRMCDLVISTKNKRYHGDEPCHVTAWCSTSHSSVSEEATATLKRLNVRLSGLVIRPKDDGSQSSKVTLLTRMKITEATSWPLKSTYLNGHPAQWIKQLHEYYREHGIEKVKETDPLMEQNDDEVF
ncbi:uncharacterized protein LOC5517020 isoform X2 [Nematostella vectensis]|nr:uncharacterized protein LOC5517020 isoform X2 [Nematostella vectensis]